MKAQRKTEISQKAQEVSRASEQFQLIHATYACQMLIKQIVMDDYKKKYDDLSSIIEQKMCLGTNYEREMTEKERLDSLIRQKSFHIDVAYIETSSEDAARVIKINNSFVINLSRKLAESIFYPNGDYNYEVIRKIRKLMSHELGHLALHTDELIQIDSTQGSKLIKDCEKEQEATFFGEKLLDLRKVRNEKIYQDGGAHKKY